MSENTENTFTEYLGPDFQQNLMWQLLVEPEFAEKIIPSLAVEYFDDPNLKRMFIIILEFLKDYGKVPNFQNKTIQQAINEYKTPNNPIEEQSLNSVLERIDLWNQRVINKDMLYSGDVIQKSAYTFIKQQEYRKIGEFILDKVKSGEIKNKRSINDVEEKFQKVSNIGDEEDFGEEVIENPENALRKEFRKTTPTGVEVIDVLTGGGLGNGEIGIILTPSGVGKTTLLTKIANTAYEGCKNVAQIIFEDTPDQIKRKHYTIWSEIPQSEIDNKNEEVLSKVNFKIKTISGNGGRLVIKKFSQEDTTIKDIKNWMLRYEKKFGIKFDILVLDYLDCLESHKKVFDKNEAELTIVKGFEALASDFQIPCWTAIQSNRSGFDAEYVNAYQSGGSIKRYQKAHFFMSVAKTKEQRDAQLANISILKARFAQDGQTFNDCIFNNDTMEIRIEDDRYKYNKLYKEQKVYDENDIDKLESTINKIHSAVSNYEENSISKTNDSNINESNNDTVKTAVLDDMLSKYNDINSKTDNNVNIDISPNTNFDKNNSKNDNVNINASKQSINKNTFDESALKKLVIHKNIINDNEAEKTLVDPEKLNVKHESIMEMLKKERDKQNILKKE